MHIFRSIYLFLPNSNNSTIQIIPTYCSKLILYELAGELNGPIDHGLQQYEIN